VWGVLYGEWDGWVMMMMMMMMIWDKVLFKASFCGGACFI
jgi:hypothetical protein